MGHVNAGDTLTFVLNNLSLGAQAYSDPSLNVAYDDPSDTIGHNHIYSTTFSGDAVNGIPAGTYVAFEDERFPNSDFNYDDEAFVFTGTAIAPPSAAPEPSAWALMIAGVGAIGAVLRRQRRFAFAA